jgi:phosphatidylserine/phosphatidylglycerophosphate/cardiolipin synthase-like enzyme
MNDDMTPTSNANDHSSPAASRSLFIPITPKEKKKKMLLIIKENWSLATFLLILALLASTLLALRVQAATGTPSTPSLDVVVSEVAWMGTTTSYNDEWIELYNTTTTSATLTGWTLSAADGTPTIILSGSIPAQGHFLLERTDDDTVPGVPADQNYAGALSNDGESLVLRDDTSTAIDQVDCSAGWFSGHADGRVPMVRVRATASGSLTSTWTYNPRCGTATNSDGISRTCNLTVTDVGAPLDYSLYFNERFTATTTTTVHTVMEDVLLSFIDNATKSIDVALYGLGRQSVVDALIDAHGRDVTIRVVGDDDAATGVYSDSYQSLVAAGIVVVTDTSSYIQHNKFLIIDDKVVWIGSTNFTDTGFSLNANNSIAITDTTLASVYTAEFEEMWTGNFHEDKEDNTAHLLDYSGTILESYFSPTDLVAFEVWDELDNADDTIHFAMFFWTDDLLTERVVERIDSAVGVYGVWDQVGAANQYSADEDLVDAGAHIRIEDFAGKVHHKFAVIDVHSSDPTVILGSYNWTDSGAYGNDENTLIIHNAGLAQAYYEEWQRLWEAIESGTGGVEIGPDYTREGKPRENLVYDHVLTNTSTATDTFVLTFASTPKWPTEMLGGSYPTGTVVLPLQVGAGMTKSFQISLTIPLGASGTATTVITASSQLDQDVWDTAIDTTKVSQKIYLPLVLRNEPPPPPTPTFTPTPTVIDTPSATDTPVPTSTPVDTPMPTNTPTPTDTPMPTDTPTPGSTGNIVITDIFYDGEKGRSEPDEYVEIRNDDTASIQMDGWTLRDESNHVFTFPAHMMQSGQTCRIYTNEDHPEWCGFSYGSGSAIWNNSGDCAELRDSEGTTIDTYCY